MANPNHPPAGRSFALRIVGASARAAAFSAVRAGASVAAADLFGDEDLRAAASFFEPAGEYPRSLAGALERMPPGPFLYTGGLENHPDLVDAMSRARTLWGNPGAVLRHARDPFTVAAVLRDAGLLVPEVRRHDDPPPHASGWLEKPLGGSGGRGISPAKRGRSAGRRPFYYERFVHGVPCSALYAAAAAGVRYLGATRQLVGAPWLHAPRFAWCGGIGPADLPPSTAAMLRTAGESLAAALGLRGIFGLDFILEGDAPRPIDLNPRYPASAEILEHALGFSAVGLHCESFAGLPRDPAPGFTPAAGIIGKAVLFAPRRVVLADDLARLQPADPWRVPEVADIPARGRVTARGRPLLTVFARGRTDDECEGALDRAAREALSCFRPGFP
jgi:predicted ATP-grasp superfamily ATP-dependent carboligase